jgi:hypothetical protein
VPISRAGTSRRLCWGQKRGLDEGLFPWRLRLLFSKVTFISVAG